MIETLGRFLENVRAIVLEAVIEAETVLKLQEIEPIISIAILTFILICAVFVLCLHISMNVMTDETLRDTKELAEFTEEFAAEMTEKITQYNTAYDEVLERLSKLEKNKV